MTHKGLPRIRWMCLVAMTFLISMMCGGGVVTIEAAETLESSSSSPSSSSNEKSDKVGLKVIDLTAKNFDVSVTDGNVWLVEFYAPWCGHCKTFAPLYENVAVSFHSSPEEKIRVAKIDGSAEKALASRFSVHAFPSFFLIDGFSVYEFEDNRSVGALMSFARGGYKSQKPMPMYSSPMGPIGIAQGLMIYAGSVVIDKILSFKDYYNFSPVVMGILLCGIGIFSTLFMMIIFVLLTHEKEKYD